MVIRPIIIHATQVTLVAGAALLPGSPRSAHPIAHHDVAALTAPAVVPLVVDVQWLAQHQRDPEIVLLHVGDAAEYRSEHIPGARHIQLSDISTPRADGALSLELPSPELLRERFSALGVSDDSHVVLYYGNDWISPATRVVHTLNFIGLGDRVSVLDGGMPAWKRAGHAVTDAPAALKAGRLSAKPVTDVTVTGEWVRANLKTPGLRIIDARSRNFYDGIGEGATKQGHVPGAVSLPFTEIADDRLMLLDRAALEQKFAAAGIRPGDKLVAYCHIGQQATAVVLAARRLGYDIRLYDGSFQDWERHSDYPVENPAAQRDTKQGAKKTGA